MGYTGEMRDGEFHGKGKLIDENGNVYEGNFQFGEFHGEGTYWVNANDAVCKGRWVRGELIEGSITSKSENFVYEGEIKNLGRHGKGTFYNYQDGAKFTGYWKNDQLDGEDDWECEEIGD